MTQGASVEQTLERFLTAFRNMDLAAFLAAFDDTASIFFPFPEQPKLLTGKADITGVFAPIFAQARARHPTGPPYLALQPLGLKIVVHHHTALVTFHLQDPGVLCRRTLLLVQRDGEWLIHHLHASNIASPLAAE